MSDSLRPHRLQHARLPCPSPSPRACSNSCHWVGDTIQSSHPLSFPSPPEVGMRRLMKVKWVAQESPQIGIWLQNPSPQPIWQWFLRVIHIRTHCTSTSSQPRTQADWIRLSRAGAWDLQPYSLAWRFTTQLGQISFSKERHIYTFTPVHLLFLWCNWHSSLLR